MGNLSGKPSAERRVVMVTGCSEGGIGYAMCKEFRRRGCTVVATARREEAMNGLEDLGIKKVQLDVTSEKSARDAVATVEAEVGRLDILVNNAGRYLCGPVAETPAEDVADVFNTNVLGSLNVVRQVAPIMARQGGGMIVNVGSIVGDQPHMWAGPYCASKAAVHSLSDTLRWELQPFNIGVVLLKPGGTKTNIFASTKSALEKLPLSLYAPFRQIMITSVVDLQNFNLTPAEDFAHRAVQQVLRTNPPRNFTYGAFSWIFASFKYMPAWMLDKIMANLNLFVQPRARNNLKIA